MIDFFFVGALMGLIVSLFHVANLSRVVAGGTKSSGEFNALEGRKVYETGPVIVGSDPQLAKKCWIQ